MDTTTDHGSELPPNAWAITWHPDEGWSLLAPEVHETTMIPDDAMALTAVMLRLQSDAEFRMEMVNWLKNLACN